MTKSQSQQQQQQQANENVSLSEPVNAQNETILCWQLMGGHDNETSQKRDAQVRHSFRYQQAPSTSLCLSILDLNDDALECGKNLLSMCDSLSNFLQTADYQVEDFALIINMIKHLLHNAKIKLLQNSTSTNIISLCDTYLSLIDILEQLLLANCSHIPSLYELRNTESARRIRNRLLEEERHELAMNMSTKCGLDTQTVWASWGMLELRRGNYSEARSKFDKCLKGILCLLFECVPVGFVNACIKMSQQNETLRKFKQFLVFKGNLSKKTNLRKRFFILPFFN